MSSLQHPFVFLMIHWISVWCAEEYRPPVSDGNPIDCNAGPRGALGINDTCRIQCDIDDTIGNVHCATAGTCVLECTGRKCMERVVLNATNSQNLEVYASGHYCMDNIDLYLPRNGNATIVVNTEGVSGIHNIAQAAKIHSQSTDHIWITCIDSITGDPDISADECEDLEIYASDAQFLSLTAIGAEIEGVGQDVAIYCPQNSNYNGPYPTSCIINATYASKADHMEIYTKNGSPEDVIFYTDASAPATLYEKTTIFCDPPGYGTEMEYPFTSSGACWSTISPSTDPTSMPSTTPTTSTTTTAIPTDTPTTANPTTSMPTTYSPTTAMPTTAIPTDIPTTSIPTTSTPTTAEPTTTAPSTDLPTLQPTTDGPTTSTPTTADPTTTVPTTDLPTLQPTTIDPTTALPTTNNPTTADPTTNLPTLQPTTINPTTTIPTTDRPTTAEPTTSSPTTATPTTAQPTTAVPTTASPTTNSPTTDMPTTAEPTTSSPTTNEPTTTSPTTNHPTTSEPTTHSPTTKIPTTAEPTTALPTTAEPTTSKPTTYSPTTALPTTSEPTTNEPTTGSPTTSIPTIAPTVPKPKNNYTITIETDDEDDKLDQDKIKQIIIAKLNITAGDIISTTINDGTVTIQISVPTDTNLDSDVIEDKLEEGIQDEYEDIDIDVSVEKTTNDTNTEHPYKSYIDDPLVLGLIIAVILLLCISCIFGILYMKSKKNKRGKAMIDEDILELTTTTGITKVASISSNGEGETNAMTTSGTTPIQYVASDTEFEPGYDDTDAMADTATLPAELEEDDDIKEEDGKLDDDMYTTPINKGAETPGGEYVNDENESENGDDNEGLYLKGNKKTPQQPVGSDNDEVKDDDDDEDNEDDQMYGRNMSSGNTRK